MTGARSVLAALCALALCAGAPAPAGASAGSDAVSSTPGLAGWWRLGEATGAAADSAGTSPGTWAGAVVRGTPGALDGDPDGAAALAGTGYLALGTAFNPAGDFTIEAWASRTATSSTRYVLSKGTSSAGFHLSETGAGAPVFRVTTTGGTVTLTAPAVSAGAWHHLAATVAGTTATLYVDGVAAAAASVSGTPKTTTNTLLAGRYSGSSTGSWSGGLDEIAVYGRALSAAEVAAHANAGIDRAEPHTTLVGGPPASTYADTATFALVASKPQVTFACQLDAAAAYTPCGPTVALTALTTATHTLRVRATDRWGRTEATPAVATWAVDLHLAPDYSPELPRTTIAASVGAQTNRTDATFTLTASRSPATFACSVDGKAFAGCGPTLALRGLAAGRHELRVVATDRFRQVEAAPAAFAWTVDLTPPDTWVLAVTRDAQGLVSFASEAGATFQCRFGTGDWSPCATGLSVAVPAPALAVRAVDQAGNIDASPANVALAAGQAAVDAETPQPFASATAAVSFSASRGAAFTCSLDAAAWAPCASPMRLDGLAWGDHAVVVRAAFPGGGTVVESGPLRWTAAAPTPRVAALQFPVLVRRSSGGNVRAAGRTPALRFALNVALPIRLTVARVGARRQTKAVAAWSIAGRLGDNRVVLSTKVLRRLRRGRYRITVTARGAKAATATFAVV
jgi:hypothetical protein